MTRDRVLALVLAMIVALGAGAWGLHAHQVAGERSRQVAAERAIDDLAVPSAFTAVACDGGMTSYARCFRADALPQAAVAMIALALEPTGAGALTRECGSSPSWHGEPMGCSASNRAMVVVATLDLNPGATSKDDLVAGTSTVAIATRGQLGD